MAFDGIMACNERTVAPGGLEIKITFFMFGVFIATAKGPTGPGGAEACGSSKK